MVLLVSTPTLSFPLAVALALARSFYLSVSRFLSLRLRSTPTLVWLSEFGI